MTSGVLCMSCLARFSCVMEGQPPGGGVFTEEEGTWGRKV